MHRLPPILADGAELIIPVLVFIFWGISSLAKLAKQASQPKSNAPVAQRKMIPPNSPIMVRRSGTMPPAPPRILTPGARVVGARPRITAPRPAVMRPAPPMMQPPQPVTPAPLPPLQLAPMRAATVATDAPVNAILVEPTEGELRDRLIWLEILGKPLALRDGY